MLPSAASAANDAPARPALVAVPTNLSLWLAAAACFFAAIPGLRLTEQLSYCDVLFVAAVGLAFVERLLRGERLANRTLHAALMAYLLAGALFVFSYCGNEVYSMITFGSSKGPGVQFSATKLTDNFVAYMEGDRSGKTLTFVVFVFNAVIVPLGLLLLRVKSLAAFRFLLLAWTCGCLFGAAYAVAYVNGLVSWQLDISWQRLGRASGLTSHPNMLGMHSALAIPGLMMLAYELRSKLVYAAVFACVVLAYVAVDYSGSRAGTLSILLTLGLTVILRGPTWPARLRRAVIAGAAGTVALIGADFLLPILEIGPKSGLSRLIGEGALASDITRDLINRTAFNDWLESPLFGVGYHALRVAHNAYLQLLHAGGLVGLSAYLIVMAVPLWALSKNFGVGEGRHLGAPLLAALITIFVVSIVKVNPLDFSIALFIALVTYYGIALRGAVPFEFLTSARSTDRALPRTSDAQPAS